MDEKKLNRIVRYIETQGGLSTQEHEALLVMLNRLYLKRLIAQELARETANSDYLY